MDENPYQSPLAAIPRRQPVAFSLGRLFRIWTARGFLLGVGVGFILGGSQLLMDRYFVHQIIWAPAVVGGFVGLLVGVTLAMTMSLLISAARLFRSLRAILERRTAGYRA